MRLLWRKALLWTGILAMCLSACSRSEDAEVEFSTEPGTEMLARLETDQGSILIRFFPDYAPEHVRNFLHHCASGFYDETLFHRVAPGFMIQGGDPNTRDDDAETHGAGGHAYMGPGTALRAEFNDLHHIRGTVSMARGRDPHSAGSQFFIMLGEWTALDGQYTAFGQVVEGMEAADRIASAPGDPISDAGGFRPHQPQTLLKCEIVERPMRDEDAEPADPEEFLPELEADQTETISTD